MQIVTAPSLILRTICRADFTVTLDLIDEMFTLMSASGGAGLAAPQVGMPYRMFITDWGDVFINPKVEEASAEMVPSHEGCLSIPGKTFNVLRHAWIKLQSGQRFEGAQAFVVAHEMDHLNGVLVSDRLMTEEAKYHLWARE